MATQPTGYSDAEISSAAAPLVQGTVSVQRDALGPVDLDNQFQEVVDLVTTTLVNDPNAAFYLFYLMSSSAADAIAAIDASLQDLSKAIAEIAGPVKPITNTSLLGDAAAALLEVNAILSKDAAVQKASFTRFTKALDAFRDSALAPNLSPTSQGVSRSHPEAVAVAYDQLVFLRTAYPNLFLTMEALGAYFDTFMSLELRQAAADRSVNKAREILEALQAAFEDGGISDAAKVAKSRAAYLQLAAVKAVVSGVRTLRDPRDPRLTATPGSGSQLVKHVPVSQYATTNAPFSIKDAVAVGKHSGPWRFTSETNQLFVSANGKDAATFALPIPTPPSILSDGAAETYKFTDTTAAVLQSSLAAPYTIPAYPYNVFSVIVDGVLFTGTITEGEQDIATVIADIQSISGLTDVLQVTDAGGGGYLKLETVSTGSSAGILVRDLGSALGFVGATACAAGTDYNRGLFVNGSVIVPLPVGDVPVATVVSTINTVLEGRYVAAVHEDGKRISLTRTDGYLKFRMQLPPLGGSYEGHSREELARCYNVLGFYDGQVGQTRPTSAQQVADTLNASEAFRAMNAEASVSRAVIVKGANGDESIEMSGLAATFATGSQIFFPKADVVDAFLTNYKGTDPYILSVEVKSGYNSSVARMNSLVASDNTGAYMSVEPEFAYDTTIGDAAYAIVKDTLQIVSKAWATGGGTSKLLISGSAADLMGITGEYYGATNGVAFFPEGAPIPAAESDQFFKKAINLGPYVVRKGDLLWQPDQGDVGVLGESLFSVAGTLAEPDIPNSTASEKVLVLDLPGLSLEEKIPAVGWLLYSYEAFNYRYFIKQIYPRYFGPEFFQQARVRPYAEGSTAELERLVNPLLVNEHPSAAQINDAAVAVQNLLYTVAGFAYVCDAIVSRKVDRIDAALSLLQERGLDLAYKALSSGDLVAFLAMDKDDASSSAAMLKAARAVAQNDVPISKTADDADVERSHLAVGYSPDASYDYSDVGQADPVQLIGESATIDDDDPAADQVLGKTLSG